MSYLRIRIGASSGRWSLGGGERDERGEIKVSCRAERKVPKRGNDESTNDKHMWIPASLGLGSFPVRQSSFISSCLLKFDLPFRRLHVGLLGGVDTPIWRWLRGRSIPTYIHAVVVCICRPAHLQQTVVHQTVLSEASRRTVVPGSVRPRVSP